MAQDTGATDALMALDRDIERAATAGDREALERMLADDFVYTHSTGKVETKAEWIDGLLRLVGQRDRVPEPERAEIHDDVGVVTGELDIVWHTDRPQAYNRYARVYREQGGTWRLISQRTFKAEDRKPAS